MSMDYEDQQEPEQKQILEERLAERRASMRRRSWWAIGIGGFIIFVVLAWLLIFALVGIPISGFVNIFTILGVFLIAVGGWGLYEAKRLNIGEAMPTSEAMEFAQSLRPVTPYYSQLMVGGFLFVFIAQFFGPLNEDSMVATAALVKPDTWVKGEYWRILTSATMHGSVLHIFFNSYATFGLGNLIESISNRAHVAIVFVLSAISGGIFSCVFMPEGNSLGASGGIMGMIGFLAVYGYKRKRQLPPDFLRSMIFNILLIAAIGLFATGFSETVKIDNAAHLGGLLMGTMYGFFTIPGDYSRDPRTASMPVTILGYAAMGLFFATCIFTILLLLERITL